jgi:hypothetical protein
MFFISSSFASFGGGTLNSNISENTLLIIVLSVLFFGFGEICSQSFLQNKSKSKKMHSFGLEVKRCCNIILCWHPLVVLRSHGDYR